jgi:hypothetical protein
VREFRGKAPIITMVVVVSGAQAEDGERRRRPTAAREKDYGARGLGGLGVARVARVRAGPHGHGGLERGRRREGRER